MPRTDGGSSRYRLVFPNHTPWFCQVSVIRTRLRASTFRALPLDVESVGGACEH